jgi:putative SOS response-associated peptidase YedK
MPAILDPGAFDLWLDPAEQSAERLLPLLVPYPASRMQAYPVSMLVNRPEMDSPNCVVPVVA